MIRDVRALEVFNSRGEKTLKAYVKTDAGIFSSCAPTGKSVGEYEAKVLETGKALKLLPRVRKELRGLKQWEDVDKKLERFASTGANLSVAISQAALRAFANGNVYEFLNPKAKYFPYPLGNVIGGGAHGGSTDIQEFLVIPKAKNIEDAIEKNFSVWKEVKERLKNMRTFKNRQQVCGRNDEGAWISPLDDLKTLDLLSGIAEQFSCRVGLDIAASQLFKKGKYVYPKLQKSLSAEEQIDFAADLIKTYNLAYVEDPFHEEDFSSFAELTRKTNRVIIAGDDLFASQAYRLKEGIRKDAGNGIIIKPNQAGTISRILDTAKLAKTSGFALIVSHRSGETCDSCISDLAVGIAAPLIKCGISGGERVAKLNRLIEIWEEVKRPQMAKLKL